MFTRFLRSLLLLLTLPFGSFALADTVTLMQGLNGYAGTIDDKIACCSFAGTNMGNDTIYAFIAPSSTSLLIKFNIFQSEGGPVPNDATINSATLSFYQYWGPTATFSATRLKKPWNETSANWTATGSGANWTTAGAFSVGNDIESAADGSGTSVDAVPNGCDTNGPTFPAVCWLNIPVTAGVQAFKSGTPNHGWKVIYTGGSPDPSKPKEFNSSENTSFPSLRPKLTIDYTPAGASCASGALRPYDAAPINGNPIAIAASGATTFEVEHFNCGGQDVAYHDNVPGNAGGAFRTTEDVDIVASTDSAGGGYVIQNFYTGEWLTYTVNVAQAGTYDFAMRVTADNPGSYHLEVDGVDVTGNVPVPNTGSLSNFVWFTKTGVNLPAGQHVLKLVSDQQFFLINQLRFTPTSGCTPPTASLTATPSSGAAPLNVTFDASGSSAPANDPITSLTLTFGDGSAPVTWADKNQAQAHTYNASSTASLTASNACGTSTPATQPISITGGGDDFPPATPPAGTLGTAVPTFHSMSLYYNPASTPANETVWMRYRRASETTWRQGWQLWFDPRTTGNLLPYTYRARGSAVYLQPNTKYYFEFGTGSSYANATWLHHVAGTTWSETFAQDGATTIIPAGNTQYNITVGGSAATGYKVYDAQGNARALPGNSSQSHCVRITVPYVIVRNLVCTGAYKWGVAITPNVNDVVIEDSDISDWTWTVGGTTSWGTYGGNEFGGIFLEGHNARVVIQRNKIHDPHFGSFPWDFGHPIGPMAITTYHGEGQNVYRYNEIYATNGDTVKTKWLLDAIAGTDNFSDKGSPGADSDIYHNIIKHTFDDAIEAEGGGRNVRVWGNYIDTVAVAVATTTVHYGPMYVFRNVFNRMRFYHSSVRPTPDSDNWDRGPACKCYGVVDGWGGGRGYYFNNTLLQTPGSTYSPPQQYDLGAGIGLYGASTNSQGIRNVWTRNNVLHVFRSQNPSIQVGTGGGANNFDFDLHSGALLNESDVQFTESSGIRGLPTYKAGEGWSAGPRLSVEGGTVGQGNFRLDSTSLGVNNGDPLPNFATDIDNVTLAGKSGVEVSGNPDRGAHDSAATQAMKFGIPAAQ